MSAPCQSCEWVPMHRMHYCATEAGCGHDCAGRACAELPERGSMVIQIWTAERYRAPFGDAHSLTSYRLGTFQSGTRHGFTTPRGRARVIDSYLAHARSRGVIVSDAITSAGVRIIVYRVTALDSYDTGRYFAITVNRGNA